MSSNCMFSVSFALPANYSVPDVSKSNIFKRQNLAGSISNWNPFCSVYRLASRLATVPSDGHAGGVNKGSMGSNVRKPQKRVMGMRLGSLDFFRTTWLISQLHGFPYDLDKQACQVSRDLLYMIFKVLYSPDNLIWRLYWSTNNTSTLPGYQSFLLYDCLIYLPFEIRHQRPLSFFPHHNGLHIASVDGPW